MSNELSLLNQSALETRKQTGILVTRRKRRVLVTRRRVLLEEEEATGD